VSASRHGARRGRGCCRLAGRFRLDLEVDRAEDLGRQHLERFPWSHVAAGHARRGTSKLRPAAARFGRAAERHGRWPLRCDLDVIARAAVDPADPLGQAIARSLLGAGDPTLYGVGVGDACDQADLGERETAPAQRGLELGQRPHALADVRQLVQLASRNAEPLARVVRRAREAETLPPPHRHEVARYTTQTGSERSRRSSASGQELVGREIGRVIDVLVIRWKLDGQIDHEIMIANKKRKHNGVLEHERGVFGEDPSDVRGPLPVGVMSPGAFSASMRAGFEVRDSK
jgi:hypothetical protein